MTALRGDRGAEDFRAATHDALAVGDISMSIEAYARLAYAMGTTSDPSRATEGIELVEALAESAGGSARFARALLHHNVGSVALARGDRAAARAAFEKARSLAADVEGSGAIELTVILRGLLLITDDAELREEIGDELVATRTRLLGARHPATLDGQVLAAEMHEDPTVVRQRLDPSCRALATYHPGMGHYIGECGYELAWLAMAAGDREATRAAADLAIAAADHGADPDHVALARAYLQLASGDVAGAVAALAAVGRPIMDASPWWQRLVAADVSLGTALALASSRNASAARTAISRATELYAQIADAMPPPILARRSRVLDELAQRIKDWR
ncbi:MAG: hypothetical protein K8M05_06775 [Deltaproteobacteria bacterium]|nr:hypothetical protein [Kofleriaceae bacterium]